MVVGGRMVGRGGDQETKPGPPSGSGGLGREGGGRIQSSQGPGGRPNTWATSALPTLTGWPGQVMASFSQGLLKMKEQSSQGRFTPEGGAPPEQPHGSPCTPLTCPRGPWGGLHRGPAPCGKPQTFLRVTRGCTDTHQGQAGR